MKPSPPEIIGLVACVTGVPAPAITGRRRTGSVARARHLAVAAIRQTWPRFSLLDLAQSVGRTNHCTALNSLRRFADLTATDPEYRQQAIELGLHPATP